MNNVEGKYLPLGTVCLLKNGKKRVMVTGFYASSPTTGQKTFDYIGCLYPEGVISSEQTLVFDHEQIEKIYFTGYSDEEEKEFKVKLVQLVENDKKNMTQVATPAMPVQNPIPAKPNTEDADFMNDFNNTTN